MLMVPSAACIQFLASASCVSVKFLYIFLLRFPLRAVNSSGHFSHTPIGIQYCVSRYRDFALLGFGFMPSNDNRLTTGFLCFHTHRRDVW